MLTHDIEVLVVGLGPVGAVGALFLAQNGIGVAAVEVNGHSASDLRASTFHAPTIEILHHLGVSDTLLGQGLRAPVYQFRDRQSGEVFAFDLGEIADRTAFPYRVQCEQHRVTDEIVAKLALLPNAQVRYRSRLLFLEQDDRGVTAYVDTGTAVERYRARYLVAADGANSVARKLLDLGFPGFTYDEKFLCLSTEYPIEQAFDDLSYVNYLSDPDEWMVLLRVPGLWRILVPASEQQADDELLSDANKDAVFQRMLGHDAPVTTRHRTIYRVHQRVCERFRVGRVCLVGDAVHLNSPMGGFGMNSGIHDAVNLGAKLVDILRHGADDALLDLYERQRRTVTQNFVQTQTIENTKMMREGWGAQRDERRRAMSRLMNDPVARRAFLLKQSMFTSLEDAAAIPLTDVLGWRKVFAVIGPSTNTIVQPDMEAMRPAGVTNQYRDIYVEDPAALSDQAFLDGAAKISDGLRDGLRTAMTCRPDYLVLGVSAISFMGGLAGCTGFVREVREFSGLDISVGSMALAEALRAYGGIRRVAFVSPYYPTANRHVGNFLTDCGFSVVRDIPLQCASWTDIARVPTERLRQTLLALDGDDVDALVQVGTNLSMVRLAAEAEARLGKPVIAINTATYWHALRANGIADRIDGFGRLLTDF